MSHETNEPSHDNEVTIETLKTPPLELRPAPLWKRVPAALVDSIIVGAAWISLLSRFTKGFWEQPIPGVGYLATITVLYYVIQEATFASTIGKHLLKLRVVGSGGDPASTREALIRNVLRLLDWLPLLYILGLVTIALSSKRQRLGDIAAGTVVTPAPEKDINPPPAPFLFH